MQVGLNHKPNGLGGLLSRNWNRIVASFGFERSNFDMELKTWARISKNEEDDDPEIFSYMGYGGNADRISLEEIRCLRDVPQQPQA
jgi:phospholipase A1/A2